MERTPPTASVVVPTRDRPADLERCIRALVEQETSRKFEIVVVNDGHDVSAACRDPRVRVIAAHGVGPAGARNCGVGASSGRFVLFTDDDTVVDRGWLEAACRFLDEHSTHVGVEGPTWSPAFDYLYEHSIENAAAGAYWTCNIAYRRDLLERLGGFSEVFPWPHCEDRDLGLRALAVGPIGYAPDMRVTHHPRRISASQFVRRARYAGSEVVLATRHPSLYGTPSTLSCRVHAASGLVRAWRRRFAKEGVSLFRRPRRLTRLSVVATGQIAVGLVSILTAQTRYKGIFLDANRVDGPLT